VLLKAEPMGKLSTIAGNYTRSEVSVMATAGPVRASYRRLSDRELLDLAQEGQSDFTAEAWLSLRTELEERALSPSSETSSQEERHYAVTDRAADTPEPVGIGEWLAAFLVYVTLVGVGPAFGFAYSGDSLISAGGALVFCILLLTVIRVGLIT
jgi:hypothetical protein